MSPSSDAWYVRFPDGRVLRASSTASLRNHISAGRIPLECWVRRSPEDEWVTLEWSQEFSDVVAGSKGSERESPPASRETRPAARPQTGKRGGVASRLDAMQLQTVGVRGLVDELLAAMDSALVASKLLVACTAGVLCGLVVPLAATLVIPFERSAWLGWAGAAFVLVVIGTVCDGLLTQMTYIELSSLRAARWAEAKAGLVGLSLRLLIAYLVTAGGAALLIFLLRLVPGWLQSLQGAVWMSIFQYGCDALALLLEIILWPVPAFALLLAPIMIIEECSVPAAIGQWWRLLRQHLGRVFLYQGLAATLGVIFTLPFAIPLAVAALGRVTPETGLSTATGFSFLILCGLVASPLIAYMAVANVFIYLNLRYEVGPRQP